MKHPLLLLTVLLIAASSTVGQVSSTNGTFTATTPSNLSLQTGATPTTRLTILNSNGNIGINTTAPADWLHVNGNVRANQFNTVNGIFNTTAAATNMSFNTNGTNRMTLLSGGNFGIGIAAPGGKLHVNGSTYVANESGGIPYAVSLGGSGGEYGSVGFGYKYVGAGGHTFVGSDWASQLNFEAGGFNFKGSGTTGSAGAAVNFTSFMKILFNGNVGIGTQTPAYKLDVNGTIGATSLQVKGGAYVANETGAPRVAIGGPGGEYGSIGFGYNYVNGGGYTYSIADWGSQLMFDVGGFTFRSAGVGGVGAPVSFNPLMKVLNNGNVGIGTTAPTGKLHIVHGGTANGTNPAIQIESTTAANFGAVVFKNDYLDEGMVGITGSAYNNGIRGARATILTNNTPGGIVVNSDNPNASIVFGTGGSATANERMRIYNNGNVGIGTATPNYKLDVNGAINATSILVNGAPISGGGASQWATNGTNINYPTGNVGIGTSNPVTKLEVDINGTSTDLASSQYTDIGLFLKNTNATDNNLNFISYGDASGYGVVQVGAITNHTNHSGKLFFGTRNGSTVAQRMLIDEMGNVGIGTATPRGQLDVAGTGNIFLANDLVAGSSQTIFLPGHVYFAPYGGSNWTYLQARRADDSGSTNFMFRTWNAGVQVEPMAILSNGNVGIGTTTPAYKLDVNGPINATSILVNGLPISGGTASQWATNGSNISYAAGNVGIGTNSPIAKLHIVSGGSSVSPGNASPISGDLVVQSTAGGRTSSVGAALEFVIPANSDGSNLWGQGRIITVAGSNISGHATGMMILGTRRYFDKGTGVQWNYGDDIVISGNGNVGIGTTAPDAKLAVKGTIHAQEVKVDLNVPGPDYVFEKEYNLMSLEDTKAYIDANKHLPEVPSAKEMEKNGVQLGEMNMLLLKKVEELTLHSIEQNKKLNEQQELIQGLIKEMQQLKTDTKKTKN